MCRRRRGASAALSEEERALWESVAKQVKPLRKHRAAKAQASQAETQAIAKPAVPPKPIPCQSRACAEIARRPWRRSVAASGQNSRVASRRSTPGSTCTA